MSLTENNMTASDISLGLIERPPRIQPPIPEQVIEIPPPPTIQVRNMPFLQLVLPLVTVVGYVLMSFSGASRNILFVLPMSFAMLFSFFIAYSTHKNEQKRQKVLRLEYMQKLATLRLEMNRWHMTQRQYYDYNYPPNAVVLNLTESAHQSRLGTRLWERRWQDIDFGALRLGLGDVPSRVVYELGGSGGNTEGTSDLWESAKQLEQDSQVVSQSPILWHLRHVESDDPNTPRARYSVGIVGKNSATVRNVTTALLVQYVAFHPPSEASLFILGATHAKGNWDWAQWLPHTNSDLKKRNYEGDRMVFSDEATSADSDIAREQISPVNNFWETLKKELDARRARLADRDTQGTATIPFLLVVIDMLPVTDQPIANWLLETPSIDTVSMILTEGDRLGAGIVFLTNEAQKIPSDCQTVIEATATGKDTTFYYSETGVNSSRFIGQAEIATQEDANRFAEKLKDAFIRVGYGAELETGISLLDLYDAKTLDDINIIGNWDTTARKTPDWLRVKLGMEGGRKVFSLYLQQDHDGVHGMIAGTTGSGKSELLLTLIAGLAITYPPDILNFLLVDYKGGTAFEPFIGLPHAVDILTNLEGNVVDRMFVALRAELDRRSLLLKSVGDSNIVDYHKRVAHNKVDTNGAPYPPLPFLFIVIDEFAEMVTKNSDYKAHFDSITRLGRALGVSLLLATQRPTGAVTDQMRSNIKYRICLRVETGDDSRELIGRSDAMFLPSNIPGRAFMQSGNVSPKLVQMAYTGGDYIADIEQDLGDIIIPKKKPISDVGRSTTDIPEESIVTTKPKKIIHELVGRIITTSREEGYGRQYKPWPDPLPAVLPINMSIDRHYITFTETVTAEYRKQGDLRLNERLNDWIKYQPADPNLPKELAQWHSGYAITNWQKTAMRAEIGLVDMPQKGEQRLLTLDLNMGPVVLFGASGWGKTTFLRTLITSLATTHTPHELIIYAIDCGRGGLDTLKDLPHLARPIDVSEQSRIERLLRVMANTIEERKTILSNYSGLPAYNTQNPNTILPAILIVIDNYADFKETYDLLQDQLVSVIRAGRAMGIYFVFTADQLTAMPSGLLNLFTQRLTLKLADVSAYSDIVGRGAISLTETPGRGFITLPERNPKDRVPHEFQIALPCVVTDKDNVRLSWEAIKKKFGIAFVSDNQYALLEELTLKKGDIRLREFNDIYKEVCQKMRGLWDSGERHLIAPIEPLETQLTLDIVLEKSPNRVAIGLRDSDRQPFPLTFGKRDSHLMVIGTPLSGKTTALYSLVLALANRHSPQDVGMILIDPQADLFTYGGKHTLGQLPHVIKTVSDENDFPEVMGRLSAEYDKTIQDKLTSFGDDTLFSTPERPMRDLFIIIDHYENIKDIAKPADLEKLADMAARYRKQNLHIILSASLEKLKRDKDTFMRKLESMRHTLVLGTSDVGELGARLPLVKGDFPLGRGFIIKATHADLVQVARPYSFIATGIAPETDSEALMATEIDAQVEALVAQYPTRAQWYFVGKLALLATDAHVTAETTPPSKEKEEIIEITPAMKAFLDEQNAEFERNKKK